MIAATIRQSGTRSILALAGLALAVGARTLLPRRGRTDIVDAMADAILIVTPDGLIARANPAAASLLNDTPGALQGRPLAHVVMVDHDLTSVGAVPLVLTDRTANRRHGGTIVVDLALTRTVEGSVIVSLRDMSERKRVEAARNELLSTISHELRTPLTSVVGSLALLRIGAGEAMSTDARRLIDAADANSRQLIRLIDDLLDLDGIEAGRLAIAPLPLDLGDVVRQSYRAATGLARAAGVALTCDLPDHAAPVLADAGRVQQVIANLLANAVRVAPRGSPITIGLSMGAHRAAVRVEDRGPGVPDDLRDRVFDRFESGHFGRRRDGTGLGLAIAREIVRHHGGTIWFEDRDDGGTCFAFALPLHDTVAP